MKWSLASFAQIASAGRIFIGTTLALFTLGWQSPSCLAAEGETGVAETPSSAAAVAGTYCCQDGNAYRVVLTLNANGTYWVRGSSCLKNKGDASGVGTWKLTERRIVLTPSKEDGWMKKEPKVFNVLKFKEDWILVRADWPDYYNKHGVTDVSCFQRQAPEDRYTFLPDEQLPVAPPFKAVVEQRQPCAAYLKTAEGKTYSFPEAFLEHRKRQSERR